MNKKIYTYIFPLYTLRKHCLGIYRLSDEIDNYFERQDPSAEDEERAKRSIVVAMNDERSSVGDRYGVVES